MCQKLHYQNELDNKKMSMSYEVLWQFKDLEEAAAAIVYFNNLHIRSFYIWRLRFSDKKPGNETVWMQSV